MITPADILAQVILIWSLLTFTPPSYGTVQFPDWALALGWCMAVFVLLWIPVVIVYKLLRAEGNPWKVCMCVVRADKLWFIMPLSSFSYIFKSTA